MKKLFILLLTVIASVCLFVGCSNLSSNSSSSSSSSLTSNSSSTSSSSLENSSSTTSSSLTSSSMSSSSVLENSSSLSSNSSMSSSSTSSPSSSSNSSVATSSSSTSSSLQDDSANYLMFVSVTNGYFVYDCDSSAENVVIPEKHKGENVVGIFENAFKDCKQLTSVTIPNSVTSIGSSVFYGCSSLTSVTIPNSVTSIGSYAFSGCSSLTSVNYTGDINKWAQISFGNSFANPIYYAKKLYINGELVTSADINTATKISDYAFEDCSSLTSVTIPDSVTSIGSNAFSKCSSLTSVTFINPNGWWYSSDSSATSGTNILSEDLQDTSTAATYLTLNYSARYWKRNV